MTNFLFWNLNKKPLEKTVAELAHEHKVDVILLAECVIEPVKLLLTLNRTASSYRYAPPRLSTKVEVFTKFSADFIQPIYEESSDRFIVRHLMLPAKTDILLVAVHLQSKMSFNEESQKHYCAEIAGKIREFESQVGHSRTILVGDLNMNPFESGMISAFGLHAVMSKRIAEKGNRTVGGREYPFFYNPMWSFLGDYSSFQPGTHYYRRSEPVTYFWNMFDQVLVRSELLNRFNEADIKILDCVNGESLLTANGFPDSNSFSDHLPIFFKLEL